MLIGILKKIPLSTYLIVPCVLLLCVLAFLINYRIHAQSSGELIGNETGTMVGRAVGSMQGLTTGQIEGYKAGKEDGLSADDTEAELSGKIQAGGKLQVLIASGTYSDVLTVGDDYAALLSQKYNAVFTVDLSAAEIELKEEGLHVWLNQPEVNFVPVGELKLLNEYQKNSFTGSAKDGYDASDNSVDQMNSRAKEKLEGDQSMMESAKTSAEKQLNQLIGAVSINEHEVFIWFKDRGGDDE